MHKNKILLTIGLVIFLDNVGGGMIMPLLPTLFMNNTIGLIGNAGVAAKSFWFGLSYMLFPIVSIFSSPYLGHLSDYKGRKFIITIGMLGLVVSNLITIISIVTNNLWLFLLSRMILGFFSGCYTAASAALMDISSSEQEKVKNIKLITLISILGFIISPTFSLLIPNKLTIFSLTIPFVIVFLLSIINMFCIILFFPNLKSSTQEDSQSNLFRMFVISFSFIFRNNNIISLSLVFLIFQIGYNFYFQIMALNLEQWHKFSISNVGFFFFIMGICYTIGMYILHPFLSRKFTDEVIINLSVIISAILVAILYLNTTTIAFSSNLILWVFNIIFFLIVPMASINIFKQFINTSLENQGLVMGVAGQITSLALILSGLMISMYIHLGKLSLLITSVMMVLVYILRLRLYQHNEF